MWYGEIRFNQCHKCDCIIAFNFSFWLDNGIRIPFFLHAYCITSYSFTKMDTKRDPTKEKLLMTITEKHGAAKPDDGHSEATLLPLGEERTTTLPIPVQMPNSTVSPDGAVKKRKEPTSLAASKRPSHSGDVGVSAQPHSGSVIPAISMEPGPSHAHPVTPSYLTMWPPVISTPKCRQPCFHATCKPRRF